MASSSKGNTEQELDIFSHFKMAFLRFFHQGYHKDAQTVMGIYGDLLERSKASLISQIREDQFEYDRLVSSPPSKQE